MEVRRKAVERGEESCRQWWMCVSTNFEPKIVWCLSRLSLMIVMSAGKDSPPLAWGWLWAIPKFWWRGSSFSHTLDSAGKTMFLLSTRLIFLFKKKIILYRSSKLDNFRILWMNLVILPETLQSFKKLRVVKVLKSFNRQQNGCWFSAFKYPFHH